MNTTENTTDELPQENCPMAELLSQKVGQLKIAEQQLIENCRTYVQDNPVLTLTVAVGLGFVLSRVLSRNKNLCPVADAKP